MAETITIEGRGPKFIVKGGGWKKGSLRVSPILDTPSKGVLPQTSHGSALGFRTYLPPRQPG